jgi:DNA-binding NarL/FixJ family response regulator
MAAKLSDAEFIARTRAANRKRSERTREKRYGAGRVSLTVWVQQDTKARLLALAAAESTPVAVVTDRLLTAALFETELSTGQESPAESHLHPVDKSDPDARNRRILELHRQGVSTREIARLTGVSKTTTARIVKNATT